MANMRDIKNEESFFPVENWVKVVAREGDDVVARRESHNIVVNQGRNWVRGLLGAALYPATHPTTGIYPGATGWDLDTGLGIVAGCAETHNNYRMRYMGLGSGGIYNNAGDGVFTESVAIASLEQPLRLDGNASTLWLKQILAQNDATDLVTFPTAYEICFQCIFDQTDVSYDATTRFVSEVAAFTSLSNRASEPNLTNHPTGVPGLVAYNAFEPIPKTQNLIIEVFWYWRI